MKPTSTAQSVNRLLPLKPLPELPLEYAHLQELYYSARRHSVKRGTTNENNLHRASLGDSHGLGDSSAGGRAFGAANRAHRSVQVHQPSGGSRGTGANEVH